MTMRGVLAHVLQVVGAATLGVALLGAVAIAGRLFLPELPITPVAATPAASVSPTATPAAQAATPTAPPDYRQLITSLRLKLNELQVQMITEMRVDKDHSAYLEAANALRRNAILNEVRSGIRALPQSGNIGNARKHYLACLDLYEEAYRLAPWIYPTRMLDLIQRADNEWRAGDDAL